MIILDQGSSADGQQSDIMAEVDLAKVSIPSDPSAASSSAAPVPKPAEEPEKARLARVGTVLSTSEVPPPYFNNTTFQGAGHDLEAGPTTGVSASSPYGESPELPLRRTDLHNRTKQRSFGSRLGTYYKPLIQIRYWLALFHLGILDIAFGWVVWILMIAGVFSGTVMLLFLPIGAVFWFITLSGAKNLGKLELEMQSFFHGTPSPPSKMPARPSGKLTWVAEDGQVMESSPKTSLVGRAHAMVEGIAGKSLIYFLAIKFWITLSCVIATWIVFVIGFGLVFTAPSALRQIKKIGEWQAKIAWDSLM